MIDWWGPVIHEAYGSSELGYMTLLNSADALRKPGSAGRPLAGVDMAILDEQGQRLPAGQVGLIHVHQPAYADFSYIGNDAARRSMERDGLKTMGDLGYLDDEGFLFIVDRASDMVISGGVNIYPAEIEAVLQLMPGVADCAVFGIPDAEFGETLAAVVQPRPGSDARRGAGHRIPQAATGRLQAAAHGRLRHGHAARGHRQDLQAQAARALLAGRRTAHLRKRWPRRQRTLPAWTARADSSSLSDDRTAADRASSASSASHRAGRPGARNARHRWRCR